ncbi:MAG: hemolysin family protein [Bifidobacteriaceae bacterium]|jgi:CBS domain containing-hemolysin-like protein|nr:hemolysin family protein [Bifidobacteriaceae bacterium]
MLTQLLLIGLGIVLTAGTAVFVVAEFSLVTVDSATLDATAGGARVGPLRRALKSTSLYLSASQVGVTITTILLGYTTQPALHRLLSDWLHDAGWFSQAAATALAAALAVVFVNVLSMLFGELIPKNLALAGPVKAGSLVAPLLLGFTAVMRPVIWLLHNSSTGLLKLMRITPVEEVSAARSAEELESEVRRSAAEGTLDEDLADRLTRTLTLPELRAVDAMTDRTQMTVVPRDATAEDVIAAVRLSGHSRLLVTDGSKDDIVGVVALRKAVAVPHERRSKVLVTALMTPVQRVPETALLGPVLVQLREAGAQMAVVEDEYGGTSGVITLEDVVEEIVGDVADEHDPSRPAPRRMADGSWRVSGQLRPDELAGLAGIDLPDDPAYETLGGLVMARLGAVPHPGDEVSVDGVVLRVETMDSRRVVAVRVWPAPVVAAGDGEAGEADGGTEAGGGPEAGGGGALAGDSDTSVGGAASADGGPEADGGGALAGDSDTSVGGAASADGKTSVVGGEA